MIFQGYHPDQHVYSSVKTMVGTQELCIVHPVTTRDVLSDDHGNWKTDPIVVRLNVSSGR
jgi:hypothetical protein